MSELGLMVGDRLVPSCFMVYALVEHLDAAE